MHRIVLKFARWFISGTHTMRQCRTGLRFPPQKIRLTPDVLEAGLGFALIAGLGLIGYALRGMVIP
jgi:hypothetical protein